MFTAYESVFAPIRSQGARGRAGVEPAVKGDRAQPPSAGLAYVGGRCGDEPRRACGVSVEHESQPELAHGRQVREGQRDGRLPLREVRRGQLTALGREREARKVRPQLLGVPVDDAHRLEHPIPALTSEFTDTQCRGVEAHGGQRRAQRVRTGRDVGRQRRNREGEALRGRCRRRPGRAVLGEVGGRCGRKRVHARKRSAGPQNASRREAARSGEYWSPGLCGPA